MTDRSSATDPPTGALGDVRPRVVLVGPPGSGKSTVMRELSQRLGVPGRDTDHDVEQRAGKPIRDVFVDDGEPYFRELERDAVAVAVREHPGVLALGGGAVMDPQTQQVLADYAAGGGTVVFLDVSLAQAVPRVGLNASRPLLMGQPRAQWQALMEARRPVYSAVSTAHVLTDALTPAEVAEQIAGLLADPAVSPTPDPTPSSTRPGEDTDD